MRTPARKPPDRRLAWVAALAVAGGLVSVLPFLQPRLWSLALVGAVPWLVAIELLSRACAPAWMGAAAIFAGQLVLHAIALRWLTGPGLSMYATGVIAGSMSGAVLGFILLTCRRRLRLPYALLAPLAWVASEALELDAWPFPITWLARGSTLVESASLAQIAEWTGVFGLTALAALVAGGLVDAGILVTRELVPSEHRLNARVAAPLLAAAAVLAAAALIGRARLRSLELADGPRIAIVQGAIPQAASLDPSRVAEIFRTHAQLSRSADLRGALLVAWPESTMRLQVERNEEWWTAMGMLARDLGRPILFGAIGMGRYAEGDEAPTNSAYLLSPDGVVVQRWDKVTLVPPAETLPGIHRSPRMRMAIGGFFQRNFGFFPFLVPGRPGLVASVQPGSPPIGALICYDDVVPDPSLRLRAAGAGILIVLSNEAWFGEAELAQHLSLARLRCIESRLPLVRATNTGLSAFIDSSGRVHASLPPGVPGTLTAAVRVTSAEPPPPWVPLAFRRVTIVAVAALCVVARRRA